MNLFRQIEKGIDESSEKTELSENMAALKKLSIFKNVSNEIIRLFAYTAQRQIYSKGTFVFQRGEDAVHAHIVLKGKINLYTSKANQMIKLQTIEENDIFGYMALLAKYRCALSAKVLIDNTELLMIDRKNFRKILGKFPEECIKIIEELVKMRMRRMEKHIDTLIWEIGGNSA